ncbi:substrate-binding domain-containing protein [Marinobacter sp. M216]|uniref:Substrate-binding domain-containing protein n=1 Tax=Marinobacter albus TaxID=3030833 RepID=A0ABT7H7B3_9GAMM|nr:MULTISPECIES: substrate-binding domain-containing protein [unclassified Marinobacter]MBW7471492.1 substrate-binding domain-containing protein [Marinobacter sp. F4218]MDK9556230.1 substrate-binding domain-containing protein [Marinobacter sp. M216]
MKHLITCIALMLSAQTLADTIIVQSTTSTQNSGLYDYLLPIQEKDTGVEVHVVAVGTGQAIKNAMHCDGDVLLVHAKPAEEKFVTEGYGDYRRDLMYNDFVIIGPETDPANVGGAQNVIEALERIKQSGAKFASRGDDSGTHKKERSLWQAAGIDPDTGSGQWYLETGSGMGATLNTGVTLSAYVLTDRATWITFANKQDATILYEGDASLFNQYGIIPVNADKCPSVNQEAAKTFAQWLVSETGQAAIGAYQVDGKQLFFPNAN